MLLISSIQLLTFVQTTYTEALI